MKDTWGEEVAAHAPADCYPCHGSMYYNLPLDCEGDECEDEDNCYCDCHQLAAKGGSDDPS